MIKLSTFSLLCSLIIIAAPPTEAAPCKPRYDNKNPTICYSPSNDKECATLGETKLDGDKKNILTCLLNDSNKPVWKSSTSSSAKNGSQYTPGATVKATNNQGSTHTRCLVEINQDGIPRIKINQIRDGYAQPTLDTAWFTGDFFSMISTQSSNGSHLTYNCHVSPEGVTLTETWMSGTGYKSSATIAQAFAKWPN